MKNKKLTDEMVVAMREDYATGNYYYKDIAKKYGCSIRTAHGIMSGESWKHVTGGVSICHKRNQDGENHPRHKLTEKQVKEIIEQYGDGFVTQTELAKMYGVSQCRISMIIRGKTWSYLKDADADGENL